MGMNEWMNAGWSETVASMWMESGISMEDADVWHRFADHNFVTFPESDEWTVSQNTLIGYAREFDKAGVAAEDAVHWYLMSSYQTQPGYRLWLRPVHQTAAYANAWSLAGGGTRMREAWWALRYGDNMLTENANGLLMAPFSTGSGIANLPSRDALEARWHTLFMTVREEVGAYLRTLSGSDLLDKIDEHGYPIGLVTAVMDDVMDTDGSIDPDRFLANLWASQGVLSVVE